MARITMLICVMMTFVMANAETFSYRFNSTPLPNAIQLILENHPELNVNFIYNELENYITNVTVQTDNAYEALRQAIGLNPVTVVKSKNTYYIEALQRGKYVYTGKVIGTDREPVVAATVMMLAPKDSTVITYGITDESGRFSIPCDRHNVIAKLSCLGYKVTYHKCNTSNVRTIIMHEQAVELGTVKIEASGQIVDHDKISIIVGKNLQKHSHDGYSLLNAAIISGLDVNPFDRTVRSEGQGVLLCINGMEASKGEIRTLNPKDVTRIDFFTGYDPSHPDSRFTLNFIVKIRDYGGAVVLEASQHLNKPTGEEMAD